MRFANPDEVVAAPDDPSGTPAWMLRDEEL
jgi:hypothetical protein